MRYPYYKDYCAMYQKYMNRQNLLDMMNLAGEDYSDRNFLDVCCGSAEAIKEANKRNARYCLGIDQETDMVPEEIIHISQPVHVAFPRLGDYTNDKKFDIVFCRQGVNYWLTPTLIYALAQNMNKDGIFIFNTFNTKPSQYPMTKEYQIDGIEFAEISYLTGDDIVNHVQIREGYPPHVTEFRWMSERYFELSFKGIFDFEIIRKGKTDIYVCKKIKGKS